jgi:hypothetical protein
MARRAGLVSPARLHCACRGPDLHEIKSRVSRRPDAMLSAFFACHIAVETMHIKTAFRDRPGH